MLIQVESAQINRAFISQSTDVGDMPFGVCPLSVFAKTAMWAKYLSVAVMDWSVTCCVNNRIINIFFVFL